VIEISRDGGLYHVTVREDCRAPAETIYDLLADLRTHMDWGGSWHPSKTQRLQSMDAPEGPATVGVEFWSIGTTTAGSWHDRSRVTEARRPSLFEFVTNGVLRDSQGRDRMSLRATHRYELAADGVTAVTAVTYALSAQMTLHTPPGDQHPRLPRRGGFRSSGCAAAFVAVFLAAGGPALRARPVRRWLRQPL